MAKYANYRRIYENHFGPIPVEENGRKYHIHHKDGNRDNNNPENLQAVTIQEHYDIHYAQEDWGACYLLSQTMKITPEEVSEISKKVVQKQLLEGRHPFVGGEIQRQTASKLIDAGQHVWQSSNHREKINAVNRTKIENGTHNFIGPSMNEKLLIDGKHISQNKEFQKDFSKIQKKNAEEQLLAGTHIFLKLNSQKFICLCGKEVSNKGNFNRHTKVCSTKLVDNRTSINNNNTTQ